MNNSVSYSDIYRHKTIAAVNEAKKLSFPNIPTINPFFAIDDSQLEFLTRYAYETIYPTLYRKLPCYWGDKCQTLAGMLFAQLIEIGIDADIVVGEVNINGTQEYDTVLDDLIQDYLGPQCDSKQALHVWVTVGDDIIIDPGIPDRMIKHYRFPKNLMPPIMIGRAAVLEEKFKVRHDPMLVGTDFIAKTNSIDPRSLISKL